jgi:hypothetical protein
MTSILSIAGALVIAGVSIAPPARLPPGSTWRVGSARLPAAGCARCVQTESWASTAPYADPPNQLPPWRTLARLGPHGILVHVTRSWEPSPPAWVYRKRALTIVRSAIHANFEGNADARVSLWSTSTWRAGSYVTVWVFFGAPHPTVADVARAQAELDRTRFPTWHVRL